jgi:putative flippase GtrA
VARWLVFEGAQRGVRAGLLHFLAIAALSVLAVTVLMWVSVSVLHMDVILSRIISAAVVGVGGYLLNLVFNIRVAGKGNAPRR